MVRSQWFERGPIIIAHRGASAYAPENTIAAFNVAFDMGADGIELDVAQNKDGEVVVIHDETVDRTTNGTGKVRELTSSQLHLLDAGAHFHEAFTGEHIPSLQEVFELFGQKLLINVEIKNFSSPFDDLPEKVTNMIKKFRLEDRVILSSFNPVALIKAGRLAPEIPLAILTMSSIPALIRWTIERTVHHQAVHPDQKLVTEEWLARNQSKCSRVNVWTVNQPEQIKALFDIGVDGIITNYPDLARDVLNNTN